MRNVINKQKFIKAAQKSNIGIQTQAEVDSFWKNRLQLLLKTGRYQSLMLSLEKSNDRNNFLALILEVNFAYQFEVNHLELQYEKRLLDQNNSSVDFQRKLSSEECVYFELRLLQQEKAINDLIQDQLQMSEGFYEVIQDGAGEKQSIIRIQNEILSKAQDKNGNAIKFPVASQGATNIVVIDASQTMFGNVDWHDCVLAARGDPYVEDVYRRGVFGLFQEYLPDCPEYIKAFEVRYSHIRETIHGILFLFRSNENYCLNYELEQYLIWNPFLFDQIKANAVCLDLIQAIPLHR